MDWSEIPPDWQVFLLWGILVVFQDIHKLGIPNAIVSFLIRGNILVPTAHHLQSSPQPLCFPHSASTIWRKFSSPQSAAYWLTHRKPTYHKHSEQLNGRNTSVPMSPACGLWTIVQLLTWTPSRSIRKLDSKTHLSEKWDTILSSF